MEQDTDIWAEIEKAKGRAAHYLLHIEETKKEYRQTREEKLSIWQRASGVEPEKAALMRERFDKRYKPLVWIRAVDLVERNLPEKMQLFLKARRRAGQSERGPLGGRPGWVVRTQMEYAELAGDREDIRAWVGERTVKSWWREIILRVIICRLYLAKKK